MRRIGLLLSMLGCKGGLTFYGGERADPPPPDEPDGPAPVVERVDTATLDSAPTGDTGTPPVVTVPWTNGDPLSPPPYTAAEPPPAVIASPCVSVGTPSSVPDGSGEVVVESHSDNNETKELISPFEGWYDLYDLSLADSGFSEANEIARIRIVNPAFPDGFSSFANCGTDYVGPDADNFATPGTQLYYLGTFWFAAGSNTLDMQHFCPSIRAGLCPTLEELGNPDSTCASGDGNSVGLDADGLCIVAPSPP
jgi:hypothetical protein